VTACWADRTGIGSAPPSPLRDGAVNLMCRDGEVVENVRDGLNRRGDLAGPM
jgi:hypothetical protein